HSRWRSSRAAAGSRTSFIIRRRRARRRVALCRPLAQRRVSCRGIMKALSATMTVRDFEHGYWYADQLKDFGERIGIPAARRLRKDELEKAIVTFLRTGTAALPTKRSLRKSGVKDVERGLSVKLRIEHYTSNRETKDFII